VTKREPELDIKRWWLIAHAKRGGKEFLPLQSHLELLFIAR
jgi:hypothetical protein